MTCGGGHGERAPLLKESLRSLLQTVPSGQDSVETRGGMKLGYRSQESASLAGETSVSYAHKHAATLKLEPSEFC